MNISFDESKDWEQLKENQTFIYIVTYNAVTCKQGVIFYYKSDQQWGITQCFVTYVHKSIYKIFFNKILKNA